VFLTIGEGPDFETTIATTGLSVAINELRLREFLEFTRGKEVSTFNSSNGGESPAGTALSLVLNWVDSSLLSPVDLSGGDLVDLLLFESVVLGWKSTGVLLGLVVGHGGEHVVSNGECVLWIGVDLIVSSVSLGEEIHSEGVLFLGSVGDTVVGNVFHESGLDSSFDIRSRAGDTGTGECFANLVEHFVLD